MAEYKAEIIDVDRIIHGMKQQGNRIVHKKKVCLNKTGVRK